MRSFYEKEISSQLMNGGRQKKRRGLNPKKIIIRRKRDEKKERERKTNTERGNRQGKSLELTGFSPCHISRIQISLSMISHQFAIG